MTINGFQDFCLWRDVMVDDICQQTEPLFRLLGSRPPDIGPDSLDACCVEATDAVSGIRSWAETEARLAAGWPALTRR